MVQGASGIRRYRYSARRYKKVQGGTRIDQLVRACTCWYVMILTVQSDDAFLLDFLLPCCPAVGAVLESSTSNHANASQSLSMFQSAACLAALVSRGPFACGGGGRQSRFFRRWRRGRVIVLSGRIGGGLGDELADQGLGHRTSPSAGSLEDLLVEIGERVAELCPKSLRGRGIECLENGWLV